MFDATDECTVHTFKGRQSSKYTSSKLHKYNEISTWKVKSPEAICWKASPDSRRENKLCLSGISHHPKGPRPKGSHPWQ